jgi:hypothetical protein
LKRKKKDKKNCNNDYIKGATGWSVVDEKSLVL